MKPWLLRTSVGLLLVVVIVLITPITHRLLPTMVGLLCLGLAFFRGTSSRPAAVGTMAAVWFLSAFSPVDVSFRNIEGPPRVVPLVMGLPLPETIEKAHRGEVVLGGCLVSGLEPEWVVLW